MRSLRPYQERALDQIRHQFRRGRKRVILCLPTGAGKTHVAAHMMSLARDKGNSSIFIADREVLVLQASERLSEDWIPHGIIMSDKTRNQYEEIRIASAQTLEARGGFPAVDFGVVDEAHGQRKMISEWMLSSDRPWIGLTATPFTAGMGKIWEGIVNGVTTDELIRDGVLCPLDIYVATPIDMDGAKVSNGEWSSRTAAGRTLPVVGNIVADYISHTNRKFRGPVPTLVFSPTVDTGEELCRHFSAAGLRFEQISYRDKSTTDRQHKIKQLAAGDIHGLISCEALAKGFDLPIIRCIVMARPYRSSMASVIQALGRGMRGDPSKTDCLLLDHARNFVRFAVGIESFWAQGCSTLDDGKKKEKSANTTSFEAVDRECRECSFVMPADCAVCPSCGASRPRRKNPVVEQPGRMTKYQSVKQRVGDIWPHLCALAVRRHPRDEKAAHKWARIQYHDMAKQWPPRGLAFRPAKAADPEIAAWVKQNLRAYVVKQKKIEEWRRSKANGA